MKGRRSKGPEEGNLTFEPTCSLSPSQVRQGSFDSLTSYLANVLSRSSPPAVSDVASPPPAEVLADEPQQNEPELPGPGAFLKGVVGQQVVVRLNSGVDYRGTLSCLDGYMNIALEQTEEYVNGVKTNEYGDAFVRGNNVLYISRLS
ncbi:hypothetical protein JCM11251_005339 [Rhodosporidiobolus azoricus]